MKHVFFSFFFILVVSLSAGCTSEFNLATNREESYLYSTDREVRIGTKVAQQVEEHYDVIEDVDVRERTQKIMDDITAICDRKDIVYFIKVIKDPENMDILNAVSLPGGYIFIFKELYDRLDNDDELAAVIAHEVGHITARHGVKRLQASYGAMFLQLAAIAADAKLAGGVGLAINSLFMKYSQEDEFEADGLSVKYLKKAGYDPQGVVRVLELLSKEQEKSPTRSFSYWRTHPFLAQRIGHVNKEITGKIGFKDYLNLTQPESF